ncbi:hypothetical protein [Actinoalloteichus hymeniacidonis]|uniref:Uncharacterized protein n=1 Tax=Actinoalloteichus hymeniacidonis TaxID=340345 RepID=A0AAC9HMA1_9PSEU|nr:hypothetical protein [Actinoalloteichus hymeniacidonis]AOS61386.1 hypothetical protein TL08_02740 [Actinoalloteichus hymeniacidonis]MBB5910609.1 hypothetical protein [Actinoalloteichus hymeniacidonis]
MDTFLHRRQIQIGDDLVAVAIMGGDIDTRFSVLLNGRELAKSKTARLITEFDAQLSDKSAVNVSIEQSWTRSNRVVVHHENRLIEEFALVTD